MARLGPESPWIHPPAACDMVQGKIGTAQSHRDGVCQIPANNLAGGANLHQENEEFHTMFMNKLKPKSAFKKEEISDCTLQFERYTLCRSQRAFAHAIKMKTVSYKQVNLHAQARGRSGKSGRGALKTKAHGRLECSGAREHSDAPDQNIAMHHVCL